MTLMTAEKWLYAILSADATLAGLVGGRIYADVAPQDAVFPCIIFNQQAPSGLMQQHNGAAATLDEHYLVKAVDLTGSFTTVEAIMNRVRVLIGNGAGAVTGGGQVIRCLEEQTVKYTSYENNIVYRYVGIQWRIFAV